MQELKKNVQRIEWVDNLKCICIIFVLISHMEYVPIVFQCIFKPVFLTTFFFLSGYVFKTNQRFRDFLFKRIKSILIPALIFSLIYLLDFGSIVRGQYSFELFLRDIGGLLRQQRGRGDVLWFLYVTFLAEISIFFITKCFSRMTGLVVSFILCEISILYVKYIMVSPPYWYIHIIFVAAFLMMCGVTIKQIKPGFIKNLYNNHLLSGMALVIYIVLCYALYYFNHCFVNINEYEANQLLWYVVEILGIYSCTWIAHLLKSNSFVSFCGQNTVVFYLVHDRIRGILNKLLVSVGCWDWVMSSQYTRIVCTVIMLPIEILIVCGVTKMILRYFPYIVGKQRVNDGCGCQKDRLI